MESVDVRQQYSHVREILAEMPMPAGMDRAAWRAFIDAFLAVEQRLDRYSIKLSTFPTSRFRVVPLAADDKNVYDIRADYKSRSDIVHDTFSRSDFFLDAPLGYALVYQTSSGKWEPISSIAFVTDYQRKRILVDQLQGGSTTRSEASNEGRRARLKFTKSPEEVLFEMVKALAHKTGMTSVGLRRQEANVWKDVASAQKDTAYQRVARSQGMLGKVDGDYYVAAV